MASNPQMQLYYVGYDAIGNPILIPYTLVPASSYTEIGVDPAVQGNEGVAPFQGNVVAGGLDELAQLHQSTLANKEGIASGTSDPDNRRTLVRKPWLDAPDGSIPFDPELAIALPAIGANQVVVSHEVPEGYDGVINAYSWNFTNGNFVDGDGSIVAQMLRNGTPIRNYNNITVQKGCIQIPRPIAPLRIFSKQVISIVIFNVSSILSGNIIASLVGYDYPSKG